MQPYFCILKKIKIKAKNTEIIESESRNMVSKYKVNIFVDPSLDEATCSNILSDIFSTMIKITNFGIPTRMFKSFLKVAIKWHVPPMDHQARYVGNVTFLFYTST